MSDASTQLGAEDERRTCTTCHRQWPLTFFHKNSRSAGGRLFCCNYCVSLRMRKHRNFNSHQRLCVALRALRMISQETPPKEYSEHTYVRNVRSVAKQTLSEIEA